MSATNAVGTGPASSPSSAVTPSAAPAVTSVTPASGATGVAVSAAPSATFSQAVTPSTVSFTVVDSGGNSVAGTVGFSAAEHGGDVHADELAGGEGHVYRDGVGGAECLGHADERPVLVEFHHRRAAVPVQHLAERDADRGGRVATTRTRRRSGVQFQASSSGFITGVRFYKEVARYRGAYRELVELVGPLLARGTFSGETASGWQELDFSAPVAVTRGDDVRGVVLLQYRVSGVHQRGAGVGGDERAADRAGRRRGVRVRLVEHLPDQHV